MKGEQLVPAPQRAVWDALNDPAMLKACVPGCESIEPTGENEYQVLMVARVGPVSAKFKGKLTLSDIKPPDSYSIAFEGQGGKLAQIGSRLVDAAAKKVADDFFKNFNEKVSALQGDEDTTIKPKHADDSTVVMPAKKASAAHDDHDEHDEHGKPIPRDPDLPDVSNTTLTFFAASSLVVFFVTLVVLFH